jgi:hypothetical protein
LSLYLVKRDVAARTDIAGKIKRVSLIREYENYTIAATAINVSLKVMESRKLGYY